MKWISYNAFPIALVLVSAILAMNDKEGWGWFLLVAALFAVYPGNKKENNNKNSPT